MTDDLEFFFPELSSTDGTNIPLPPDEMRFLDVHVEPVLDDGPVRIRVYVETTAFQQRPYLEVSLLNKNGDEIAYFLK